MKINFRSPRYALPLILLPFILLFFYVYKSSFGKPKPIAKGKDSLQYNIADVSDQVRKSTLSDKLDAYRDQYKKADGYTAINRLQDDTTTTAATPSLYNEREKRLLDSVQKALNRKYGQTGGGATNSFQRAESSPGSGKAGSDQALADALNRMKQIQRNNPPNHTAPTDPMQLFRQQMALIDSMEKTRDPEYKAIQQKKQLVESLAKESPPPKPLTVSKAEASSQMFNTIKPENHDGMISAIVDQDITGYAGSRLRIRLLDDMMAGNHLIRQGTYLYAQITGFSGQRVLLSVSSIMQGDQILPVKLDIYDNDGLAGLYVPASAFRDFTKELGSGASQGLTLQQAADGNNQMVMSLVQRMFESTTTAVSKLIRQNKAKLKYNTLVYLIYPQQLRNHQTKE